MTDEKSTAQELSSDEEKAVPEQFPPLDKTPRDGLLYAKLARVMQELERVPKNGYNSQHQYYFATDADVLDAIRGQLGKLGVAFLPRMIDVTQTPNGKAVNTLVRFEFTFACADSGATWKSEWQGESIDWSDKGISKAATLGLKYFLLKTFMISTGDSDEDPDADSPERGEQKASKANQRQQQQTQRQQQQPPPATGAGQQPPQTWATADNIKKLQAAVEKDGVVWAEIPSLIAAIPNPEDLDAWAKRFASGPEAGKAIREAFAARQQNTAPAKPKYGGSEADKHSHKWTEDEIKKMDALAGAWWDSLLVMPHDGDSMLKGMDKIGWTQFSTPDEAKRALMAYAMAQKLPIVATAAQYQGQFTALSNGLLVVRQYSRDKLRELSENWRNYTDSWEKGKKYDLAADNFMLVVSWEDKDGKYNAATEIHEYDVEEVDFSEEAEPAQ